MRNLLSCHILMGSWFGSFHVLGLMVLWFQLKNKIVLWGTIRAMFGAYWFLRLLPIGSPSWLCCNLYHEGNIARFCDSNKNEGTHQIKNSSFHNYITLLLISTSSSYRIPKLALLLTCIHEDELRGFVTQKKMKGHIRSRILLITK